MYIYKLLNRLDKQTWLTNAGFLTSTGYLGHVILCCVHMRSDPNIGVSTCGDSNQPLSYMIIRIPMNWTTGISWKGRGYFSWLIW